MIFLYEEHEGEAMRPWETDLDRDHIMELISACVRSYEDSNAVYGFGKCDKSHGWQCDILYPPLLGGYLPLRLHSIVLPTGERWDAHNREWMSMFNRPFSCSQESLDRRFNQVIAVCRGLATYLPEDLLLRRSAG